MGSRKSGSDEPVEAPDETPDEGTGQATADGGGPGNVDQIRDILFGRQMRDYEQRFQRLEDSFRQELAALREDLRAQLETLEQHFTRELAAAGAALDREVRDRHADVRGLGEDLRKASDETRARLSDLETDLDGRATELREQILDRADALARDAQARDERLSGELAAATRELRTIKVDRGTLAQLLADVAMRISDDAGDGQVT